MQMYYIIGAVVTLIYSNCVFLFFYLFSFNLTVSNSLFVLARQINYFSVLYV